MNPAILAALGVVTVDVITISGSLLVAYISLRGWKYVRQAARDVR